MTLIRMNTVSRQLRIVPVLHFIGALALTWLIAFTLGTVTNLLMGHDIIVGVVWFTGVNMLAFTAVWWLIFVIWEYASAIRDAFHVTNHASTPAPKNLEQWPTPRFHGVTWVAAVIIPLVLFCVEIFLMA